MAKAENLRNVLIAASLIAGGFALTRSNLSAQQAQENPFGEIDSIYPETKELDIYQVAQAETMLGTVNIYNFLQDYQINVDAVANLFNAFHDIALKSEEGGQFVISKKTESGETYIFGLSPTAGLGGYFAVIPSHASYPTSWGIDGPLPGATLKDPETGFLSIVAQLDLTLPEAQEYFFGNANFQLNSTAATEVCNATGFMYKSGEGFDLVTSHYELDATCNIIGLAVASKIAGLTYAEYLFVAEDTTIVAADEYENIIAAHVGPGQVISGDIYQALPANLLISPLGY